jgi:hypothetical protein
MRLEHILLAVGLCTLGTGCGIVKYGSHNIIEAPLDQVSELAECCRNRHMADQAWSEFQKAEPEHVYSVHFARGFKDGYADYLYAGGTGDPPVAPPWRYRKVGYETPQGVQAIQDWFAGFRQGAYAAYVTGYRQFVVVPAAVSGAPGRYASQWPQQQAPAEATLPMPSKAMPEAPEEKPMPVAPQ